MICFQYKSNLSLFWLWQTAWIVVHLIGFGAFGQTSSEFHSGGNSHCHLQHIDRQVGRQADSPSPFQAMLKKRLRWSSHGEGRCPMSRLKKKTRMLHSNPMCVCVCVC
ncbi:hypothetical protein AMECASPLE_016794, partial [Ameca splendens]